MITLYDLVLAKLINSKDHLSFLYKSFTFTCQIDAFGVLYNFQSNGKRIFTERVPFDSLSMWADTCIQEIAREYVTRFSSWKRVKHLESGLCLNVLRQMYSQFAVSKPPVTANSVNSIRQYCSSLSRYCEKLEACIEHWEKYQVGAEKRPPESIHCKPSCLGHILSAQERYLREKNTIEAFFTKASTAPEQAQTDSKNCTAAVQC